MYPICIIMYYNEWKMHFCFNFTGGQKVNIEYVTMRCSNDEYKKIVDFMKSKDENYFIHDYNC